MGMPPPSSLMFFYSLTVACRNVKISKGIEVIAAGAVLAGDLDGIPSDDSAQPIGQDAVLKDMYDGAALKKVMELSGSTPDTKIGEAFARLQEKAK